jgi:CheY-like chemotaxis protein
MAHVLVVDDEESIREAMRLALDMEGHTVVTAATGPECVQLLQETPHPFVVLLDYFMPDMTGMDVLDTLLHQERTDITRHCFILMSASVQRLPLDLRQFLDRYQIPVLDKPFDVDTLFDLVTQAAAEQRAG